MALLQWQSRCWVKISVAASTAQSLLTLPGTVQLQTTTSPVSDFLTLDVLTAAITVSMTDHIQQLAVAQTTILSRTVVTRTRPLIALAHINNQPVQPQAMSTDIVTTPGTLATLACGPTRGLCLKTATQAEPTLAAILCAELFLDAPAPTTC